MLATVPQQSHQDNHPTTYSNGPTSTNEHTSSWSQYEVISDDSVRIFFSMSNPQCYGVRAIVDEDATTVRITLHEGTLPDAPAECATVAANASLLLTTRNPIGTRSIVPGK